VLVLVYAALLGGEKVNVRTRRFVLLLVSVVALVVTAAFLIGGQSAAGTGVVGFVRIRLCSPAYLYRWNPTTASLDSRDDSDRQRRSDRRDRVQNGGHQDVWFTESVRIRLAG